MYASMENYSIKDDQRNSLTHEAMQSIAKIIGDRNLQPGDKLPSAAELGNILNVSRVVVREAISGLSAIGLVESRQGQGTVVMDHAHSLIRPNSFFIEANQETLLEVVQTRRIFEVEIGRIAAINRTEEDIKLIERYHLALGVYRNSIDDIVECDINFHLALVYCTKNRFLSRLMSGVIDIMKPSRMESFKDPTAVGRAFKEHGEIINGIKLRDPELTAEAISQHLRIVEDKLKMRKLDHEAR